MVTSAFHVPWARLVDDHTVIDVNGEVRGVADGYRVCREWNAWRHFHAERIARAAGW